MKLDYSSLESAVAQLQRLFRVGGEATSSSHSIGGIGCESRNG